MERIQDQGLGIFHGQGDLPLWTLPLVSALFHLRGGQRAGLVGGAPQWARPPEQGDPPAVRRLEAGRLEAQNQYSQATSLEGNLRQTLCLSSSCLCSVVLKSHPLRSESSLAPRGGWQHRSRLWRGRTFAVSREGPGRGQELERWPKGGTLLCGAWWKETVPGGKDEDQCCCPDHCVTSDRSLNLSGLFPHL